MKVMSLIEDVDLLVPNAISYDKKIGYLNQNMSILVREFRSSKESTFTQSLEVGEGSITLPGDCRTDLIRHVIVGGNRHEYSEAETNNVWRTDGESIHLLPIPNRQTSVEVVYAPVPSVLELESEIPILKDYERLLTYAVALDVARRQPDFNRYEMLLGEYQNLFMAAKKQITKPRRTKSTITRRWG